MKPEPMEISSSGCICCCGGTGKPKKRKISGTCACCWPPGPRMNGLGWVMSARTLTTVGPYFSTIEVKSGRPAVAAMLTSGVATSRAMAANLSSVLFIEQSPEQGLNGYRSAVQVSMARDPSSSASRGHSFSFALDTCARLGRKSWAAQRLTPVSGLPPTTPHPPHPPAARA